MEQEQVVLLEKAERTGWIYLNRPGALNGINLQVAKAFKEALVTLSADQEVRVIVVSGKGKAFSAGGDLKAIQALETEAESKAFVEEVGSMVEAITACSKPVIAMVNGVAAGAGFNLALACDLIFAAETASFIQSFTNVGLIPDCGGHYFLTRALGKHWTKEIMFEASPITALEALEYGFINQVYFGETLLKETKAYASMLSEKPPLAIAACKALVNQGEDLTLQEVLKLEAQAQGRLMMSDDVKEGVAAFFDKRKPVFSGK